MDEPKAAAAAAAASAANGDHHRHRRRRVAENENFPRWFLGNANTSARSRRAVANEAKRALRFFDSWEIRRGSSGGREFGDKDGYIAK